ncbi:hypothetical protein Pfo_018591 [Paulownia fortunei]|nr:hypothetical protein Pfo_018591 [Paulownia fortunei]
MISYNSPNPCFACFPFGRTISVEFEPFCLRLSPKNLLYLLSFFQWKLKIQFCCNSHITSPQFPIKFPAFEKINDMIINVPNNSFRMKAFVSIFSIISLCLQKPENKKRNDGSDVIRLGIKCGKFPILKEKNQVFSLWFLNAKELVKMFPDSPCLIPQNKKMLNGFYR